VLLNGYIQFNHFMGDGTGACCYWVKIATDLIIWLVWIFMISNTMKILKLIKTLNL